ncbi:MAG: hypothetical protein HY691_00955 [Chloroflexi bacterium]|nr:hypothetical protein [Chloroflexota bacterium]
MASQRGGGGFRLGFIFGFALGAAAAFVATARAEDTPPGSLAGQAVLLRARIRRQVDAVRGQVRQAVDEGRQAAAELRQEFEATLAAADRE